ncbi:hypothetical protein [Kistimonas asteriae]|uniref:hypothetical protein n=1 Tax=Kistimonas asteriae TaxID=517724 RepID=UPI001BAA3746|nr:hypothetical protein [Kistimonas asteriae]
MASSSRGAGQQPRFTQRDDGALSDPHKQRGKTEQQQGARYARRHVAEAQASGPAPDSVNRRTSSTHQISITEHHIAPVKEGGDQGAAFASTTHHRAPRVDDRREMPESQRPSPLQPPADWVKRIDNAIRELSEAENTAENPVQWCVGIVEKTEALHEKEKEFETRYHKALNLEIAPIYGNALEQAIAYLEQEDVGKKIYQYRRELYTIITLAYLHPPAHPVKPPERSSFNDRIKKRLMRLMKSEIRYLTHVHINKPLPLTGCTDEILEDLEHFLREKSPVHYFLTKKEVESYHIDIDNIKYADIPETFSAGSFEEALAYRKYVSAYRILTRDHKVRPAKLRYFVDTLTQEIDQLKHIITYTRDFSLHVNWLNILIIFKKKLLGTINKDADLKPLINTLLSKTVKYIIVEIAAKSPYLTKTQEAMPLIEDIICDPELDQDCQIKWAILQRPELDAAEVAQDISGFEQHSTARLQEALDAINRNTRAGFENAALLIKPLLAIQDVIKTLPTLYLMYKQIEEVFRKPLIVYFFVPTIKELDQLRNDRTSYNDLIPLMHNHKETCISNEQYRFLLDLSQDDRWQEALWKVWGKSVRLYAQTKKRTIHAEDIADLLLFQTMAENPKCHIAKSNIIKTLTQIFADSIENVGTLESALTPEERTTLAAWGEKLCSVVNPNPIFAQKEQPDNETLLSTLQQWRSLQSDPTIPATSELTDQPGENIADFATDSGQPYEVFSTDNETYFADDEGDAEHYTAVEEDTTELVSVPAQPEEAPLSPGVAHDQLTASSPWFTRIPPPEKPLLPSDVVQFDDTVIPPPDQFANNPIVQMPLWWKMDPNVEAECSFGFFPTTEQTTDTNQTIETPADEPQTIQGVIDQPEDDKGERDDSRRNRDETSPLITEQAIEQQAVDERPTSRKPSVSDQEAKRVTEPALASTLQRTTEQTDEQHTVLERPKSPQSPISEPNTESPTEEVIIDPHQLKPKQPSEATSVVTQETEDTADRVSDIGSSDATALPTDKTVEEQPEPVVVKPKPRKPLTSRQKRQQKQRQKQKRATEKATTTSQQHSPKQLATAEPDVTQKVEEATANTTIKDIRSNESGISLPTEQTIEQPPVVVRPKSPEQKEKSITETTITTPPQVPKEQLIEKTPATVRPKQPQTPASEKKGKSAIAEPQQRPASQTHKSVPEQPWYEFKDAVRNRSVRDAHATIKKLKKLLTNKKFNQLPQTLEPLISSFTQHITDITSLARKHKTIAHDHYLMLYQLALINCEFDSIAMIMAKNKEKLTPISKHKLHLIAESLTDARNELQNGLILFCQYYSKSTEEWSHVILIHTLCLSFNVNHEDTPFYFLTDTRQSSSPDTEMKRLSKTVIPTLKKIIVQSHSQGKLFDRERMIKDKPLWNSDERFSHLSIKDLAHFPSLQDFLKFINVITCRIVLDGDGSPHDKNSQTWKVGLLQPLLNELFDKIQSSMNTFNNDETLSIQGILKDIRKVYHLVLREVSNDLNTKLNAVIEELSLFKAGKPVIANENDTPTASKEPQSCETLESKDHSTTPTLSGVDEETTKAKADEDTTRSQSPHETKDTVQDTTGHLAEPELAATQETSTQPEDTLTSTFTSATDSTTGADETSKAPLGSASSSLATSKEALITYDNFGKKRRRKAFRNLIEANFTIDRSQFDQFIENQLVPEDVCIRLADEGETGEFMAYYESWYNSLQQPSPALSAPKEEKPIPSQSESIETFAYKATTSKKPRPDETLESKDHSTTPTVSGAEEETTKAKTEEDTTENQPPQEAQDTAQGITDHDQPTEQPLSETHDVLTQPKDTLPSTLISATDSVSGAQASQAPLVSAPSSDIAAPVESTISYESFGKGRRTKAIHHLKAAGLEINRPLLNQFLEQKLVTEDECIRLADKGEKDDFMAAFKPWYNSVTQPSPETSETKEKKPIASKSESTATVEFEDHRNLNKQLKKAGMHITLTDLSLFIDPSRVDLNDCMLASHGNKEAIHRVKSAYERWKQPSLTAAPATIAKEATVAVAETLTSEEALNNLLQQIKAVKPSPHSPFDQPLTTDICTDGGERTFDKEREKLEYSIEAMRQQVATHDKKAKGTLKTRQKLETMILEYRFNRRSLDETKQAIEQEAKGELQEAMLEKLQTAKPFRQTHLTTEETSELQLYRQGIEILHENRQPSKDYAASCQGWVNSLEYGLSGHGYHQVIGTDEEIEWYTGDKSPVLCWDKPEIRDTHYNVFLHQASPDAFRAAIHRSQQWEHSGAIDSTEQLNGERYVLLRTSPSGEAGHFVNMVRSKATGRFIVIDGKKLNVFPVIHENGEFTDEAYEELGNRNVHVMRMDLIPDDTLEQEFKKCTELLENYR